MCILSLFPFVMKAGIVEHPASFTFLPFLHTDLLIPRHSDLLWLTISPLSPYTPPNMDACTLYMLAKVVSMSEKLSVTNSLHWKVPQGC